MKLEQGKKKESTEFAQKWTMISIAIMIALFVITKWINFIIYG